MDSVLDNWAGMETATACTQQMQQHMPRNQRQASSPHLLHVQVGVLAEPFTKTRRNSFRTHTTHLQAAPTSSTCRLFEFESIT